MAVLLVRLCGPGGEIGIFLPSRGGFWFGKAEDQYTKRLVKETLQDYEIERLELKVQERRKDWNRKVIALNAALEKKETIPSWYVDKAQKELKDALKLMEEAKRDVRKAQAALGEQGSTEL